MCVPLVVVLSTIVLHSVSAGGVYCAKTASDRAAALGLDYPGLRGAPDLFGPTHHGLTLQPHQNNPPEMAETEPNMASYGQNQPGGSPFDDTIHKQAHTGRSDRFLLNHGPYKPIQSEYTSSQVLSFPTGHTVGNRKSGFEEVKHVALPALDEAPGQSDLVNWDPQGRNKLPSFVYNEHDLIVDEPAPNRRGMSLSGLPQSKGYGAYQRGLTGYGQRREMPVLGSSRFKNKGHASAMTGRAPVLGGWERFRFPGHFGQYRHRSSIFKPLIPSKSVLRRLKINKLRSSSKE